MERRGNFRLREMLNDCQLGSREVFKTLMKEYPAGWIELDRHQMANLFNVWPSHLGRAFRRPASPRAFETRTGRILHPLVSEWCMAVNGRCDRCKRPVEQELFTAIFRANGSEVHIGPMCLDCLFILQHKWFEGRIQALQTSLCQTFLIWSGGFMGCQSPRLSTGSIRSGNGDLIMRGPIGLFDRRRN
jgi:hypothetical protein